MTPHVVGFDLSLTCTGFAYEGGQQTFTSPSDDLTMRLGDLHEWFRSLLCVPLDLIVVEDLPRNPRFGGVPLGMVHACFRLTIERLTTPVLWVTPASLKMYATGHGNASKSDVRMGVFQRFGVDIPDDNAADAYVLRAIGLHVLGHPLAELPKVNLKALDKLELPEGVSCLPTR